MFTLILTIILASASTGSPSGHVAQVPGFTNKEQCLIAANAWLDQQKGLHDGLRAKYTAICAKL